MAETNMVSLRNYFTIMTMMGVIAFLFLFIGVGKERLNDYDTNPHIENRTTRYTSRQDWTAREGSTFSDFEKGGYVLLITDRQEGLGSIVEQWCRYTKRNLLTRESLPDSKQIGENLPEMMIVDSVSLTTAEQAGQLLTLAKKGVNMVFCDLPDTDLIKKSSSLRKLLGIRQLRAQETELTGVHLYEDFLLGGESIYKAETPEDEERQDLELNIPWCVVGPGTKVYMTGLIKDTTIDNEELPAIVWRAAYENARIFVVNGDYMSELTGLGFLSAFTKELAPYVIYPVVNAQNFVAAGYPVLASENGETMQRIYTRNQLSVVRDIIGPGLATVTEMGDFRMSAMMTGQMDFSDGNLPSQDTLIYFLKQMNEGHGEMGLSLLRADGTSLMDAAVQMDDFLKNTGMKRIYSSLYLSREDAADIRQVQSITEQLLKLDSFGKLCTVICDYSRTEPVLSYLLENTTLQGGALDGYSHTFSQDLSLKSLETALGYSSVIVNLEQILWPGEGDAHWEVLYDDFSSNMSTYWKPFQSFDTTTLTESDQRIRRFLALDYHDSCEGDIISVDIENLDKEAWFLFRTANKTLVSVTGGQAVKVEDHVWLIETQRSHLEIECKPEREVYYSQRQ